MNRLKAEINRFFNQYPDATYRTLCDLAEWARERKIHYMTPANLLTSGLRRAYAAGVLPELDPAEKESLVDSLIAEALSFEADENWRRRLFSPSTEQAKLDAYQYWRDAHITL